MMAGIASPSIQAVFDSFFCACNRAFLAKYLMTGFKEAMIKSGLAEK